MSAAGQVIRQPVNMVRRTGRNAQGVRLMGLNDGDSVVSMACLTVQPDSDGTVDAAADEMNGEVTELPILDVLEPDEVDIEEEAGEALEDDAE